MSDAEPAEDFAARFLEAAMEELPEATRSTTSGKRPNHLAITLPAAQRHAVPAAVRRAAAAASARLLVLSRPGRLAVLAADASAARQARLDVSFEPGAGVPGLARRAFWSAARFCGGVLRAATFRRRGILVAVCGPDGSGKGVLIDGIRRAAADVGCRTHTFQWRPRLLPDLVFFLTGRNHETVNVDPHGARPSGRLVSLLRVGYYLVDYVLGYWLIVRPRMREDFGVAIFDRYYYDWVMDPLRYRAHPPDWLLRALTRLVPRADVVLLTHAPASVMAARKPELPVDELERQLRVMDWVEAHVPHAVRINTRDSVEESVGSACRAVLNAMFSTIGKEGRR